jgi:PPOX class probable F420-dependent enzyme
MRLLRSMFSPDARRFVLAARVGHLATADTGGVPHLVPICFALLHDQIVSVLDRKPKRSEDPRALRRVANVLNNPRVAFLVDTYDEDWNRLGFVLVHGAASLADSGPVHAAALQALRQRYTQYRDMGLSDRPVLVISPDRVTAWGALDSRGSTLQQP